jgi:hypothetical protein
VAEFLRHFPDGCGMHGYDKLGRAAVGDLTRSKGGRVYNEFRSAQALLAKAQKMATCVCGRCFFGRLLGVSGCLRGDHVQFLTLTAFCSLLVSMLYACAQALLVYAKPPRPAGGALQGHQVTGDHPQDRPLNNAYCRTPQSAVLSAAAEPGAQRVRPQR